MSNFLLRNSLPFYFIKITTNQSKLKEKPHIYNVLKNLKARDFSVNNNSTNNNNNIFALIIWQLTSHKVVCYVFLFMPRPIIEVFVCAVAIIKKTAHLGSQLPFAGKWVISAGRSCQASNRDFKSMLCFDIYANFYNSLWGWNWMLPGKRTV